MLANPGDHIIGIGKHVFERDPWVARSLFDAFEGSKRIWQVGGDCPRRRPGCSPKSKTPWSAWVGMDWQPSGVGPNKHMIQTLCDEALTQGLIARALDAQRVFAEFEAVYEAEEGHHQ